LRKAPGFRASTGKLAEPLSPLDLPIVDELDHLIFARTGSIDSKYTQSPPCRSTTTLASGTFSALEEPANRYSVHWRQRNRSARRINVADPIGLLSGQCQPIQFCETAEIWLREESIDLMPI